MGRDDRHHQPSAFRLQLAGSLCRIIEVTIQKPCDGFASALHFRVPCGRLPSIGIDFGPRYRFADFLPVDGIIENIQQPAHLIHEIEITVACDQSVSDACYPAKPRRGNPLSRRLVAKIRTMAEKYYDEEIV
jgi:hypothetical protein